MLATLLFTIPPLLGVRKVKPSLVFRREMEEVKQTRRWRHLCLHLGSLLCSGRFCRGGHLADSFLVGIEMGMYLVWAWL